MIQAVPESKSETIGWLFIRYIKQRFQGSFTNGVLCMMITNKDSLLNL